MKLEGKKILVTGGAGFIGSHIIDLLLDEGCAEIVAIDNMVRGRPENLADALARGAVRLLEGDIRDHRLMEGLVKDADIVFHQAALRITQCAEEPREALEVMVDATFDLLELCVKHQVEKIIAASSASIYGMADQFPITEAHHPYNNRTLYGAAKVFNEGLLRGFHEMYGLNYVALRYFNVYGLRMDIHGVYTEVLIRWMERIAAGEPPLIFGPGDQTMDFVYIRDVARANILAAKTDVTRRGVQRRQRHRDQSQPACRRPVAGDGVQFAPGASPGAEGESRATAAGGYRQGAADAGLSGDGAAGGGFERVGEVVASATR